MPGCDFEQTTLSYCTLFFWGAEIEPVASSGPFGFSPAMTWACQELCCSLAWHIPSIFRFVSCKQEQLQPRVSFTCAHGQPLFLDVYWRASRALCGLKYLDIL